MNEFLNVAKIQRFSTDDGPGIRTTVFLKGCNLKCKWCHNPENISIKPSILKDKSKCINCGNCDTLCVTKARQIVGESLSIYDIFKEILLDKKYYNKSGGGVTFSGGEPMLQANNLLNILKLCKSEGIHVAIDTAGNIPYDSFQLIEQYVDVFLYDIKFIDSRLHKKYTGVGNELILDNVTKLSKNNKLIIRTPLIPGINDKEELDKIKDYVKTLDNIEKYDVLPYHELGVKKYEMLNMKYELFPN